MGLGEHPQPEVVKQITSISIEPGTSDFGSVSLGLGFTDLRFRGLGFRV